MPGVALALVGLGTCLAVLVIVVILGRPAQAPAEHDWVF